VHLAATLPRNYIALEYPTGSPEWWYDIVEGLPYPIVQNSFIDVWDAPGLGVSLNASETRKRLADEDKGFLD
jgi:L-alanine-DL-glutamate epimerase-like enolase superfamily enzyme